jgi:hypothetical protein
MAPRVPVPLREVVYTLSPYQQEVLMQGIEKLPGKAVKFVKRVSGSVRRVQGQQGALQGRAARAARGGFPASALPMRRARATGSDRGCRGAGGRPRSAPRPCHPQNGVGYAIMSSVLFLPIM